MHSLLGLRITLDQNVRLPQRIPCRAMLVQQALEPPVAGLSRQREIIGCLAAPSGARHGDVLGEVIRPAPLDLHADIEGKPVAVTVEGQGFRR